MKFGALVVLFVALPLTAADPYPRACVDCHDKGSVLKMSAVMERLKSSADPVLVAKLQPLAPKGITLKGRYPSARHHPPEQRHGHRRHPECLREVPWRHFAPRPTVCADDARDALAEGR
jgi:hypothetical protein